MLTPGEEQPLNEIATICRKEDGYGMIIEVHSSDQGILGNTVNPARAHLGTADGKYLGKFAITDQPPGEGTDVLECDKNHAIPVEFKKKIAVWARARYHNSAVTNWWFLKEIWGILHQ